MVRPALIPCLRYKDAPAAIDFLCEAFGFARFFVVADEADAANIHHAQLTLDGNMIMLASAADDGEGQLFGWKTAAELGGITMCVYAVIEEPDAHAERARAAGARIINEPSDNKGYPGRGYNAADPEGNVWSFSDYDPWVQP
jgi:uncharacterized glyoxalase superfamily protein PhnB